MILQWSSRTASDLDLDGEELEATHGVVVAEDDERAGPVRVESDGSVDSHLQLVLELSTGNKIIKTRHMLKVDQTILPLDVHQEELTHVG